jgi:hypothetical protein
LTFDEEIMMVNNEMQFAAAQLMRIKNHLKKNNKNKTTQKKTSIKKVKMTRYIAQYY